KAYVYLPQIEKENTLRQLASGFLERVFDGALDEYLVHALGSRKVSKDELEVLEEMIAAARSKNAHRTARKKKGKSP
ncbi:MAG: BlaI/MecI/CopY family transcriptional regulator, partial [Planctomycetales bacterium]|nr:BlaI/MecI/CopY family transcriptional regulator [Planctomycetales bacterium]